MDTCPYTNILSGEIVENGEGYIYVCGAEGIWEIFLLFSSVLLLN